jgi:hypothetical protein
MFNSGNRHLSIHGGLAGLNQLQRRRIPVSPVTPATFTVVSLSRRFHPFRILALGGILAAWLLNFAVALEWNAGELRGPSATPVEAAAIDAPAASIGIETCHHHPEGCPKSCLCPKTRIVPEGASSVASDESVASPREATLNEPSWVTCSEDAPHAWSPAFAVYIPASGIDLRLAATTSDLAEWRAPVAPRVAPEALLKVPIRQA